MRNVLDKKNMPTSVRVQAIMTAPSAAPLAMFCGRLNTPPPIIEPTTMPAKSGKPSLALFFGVSPKTSSERAVVTGSALPVNWSMVARFSDIVLGLSLSLDRAQEPLTTCAEPNDTRDALRALPNYTMALGTKKSPVQH